MKRLLFALMLLLPLCLGETSFSQNGLTVATNLDVQEHQMLSLTTGGAITTYVTYLTIEVKNTAPTKALGVTISQDLSQIEGILNYSPAAYLSAPRNPVWNFDSLEPGKSIVVSAELSGERAPSLLSELPAPQVKFRLPSLKLSAPQIVDAGDKYEIAATSEGKPVSGAEITVSSPQGEKSLLITDSEGKAEFTPRSGGYYTYLIRNYPLEQYLSTKVTEPAGASGLPPTASAAVSGGESGLKLEGLIPLVAGLIVAAAIVFIAMSYLAGRREDEAAEPPSQPQEDKPYYSYTYDSQQPQQALPAQGGQPVGEQEKRDLLSSRRAEQGEQAPQEETSEEAPKPREIGEQTSIYPQEGLGQETPPTEQETKELEEGEYTQEYSEPEGGLEAAIDEELEKAEEPKGASPEPKPPEEEADWEEEQSSIQRQLELIREKLAKTRKIDKAEKELDEAERSLPEEEAPTPSGKFTLEEEEEAEKGKPTPIEEAEIEAQEPEEREMPKIAKVSRPLARYTPVKIVHKGKEKPARKSHAKAKSAGKKRR